MCYFGFRTFSLPALNCALDSEVASLIRWGQPITYHLFLWVLCRGPAKTQIWPLRKETYLAGSRALGLFPGLRGSCLFKYSFTSRLMNLAYLKNLITCSLLDWDIPEADLKWGSECKQCIREGSLEELIGGGELRQERKLLEIILMNGELNCWAFWQYWRLYFRVVPPRVKGAGMPRLPKPTLLLWAPLDTFSMC